MPLVVNPPRNTWGDLLRRPTADGTALEGSVAAILEGVRQGGDAAVRRYTKQFDKVELGALEATSEEITAAAGMLTDDLKAAIGVAKSNISAFHSAQRESVKVIETCPGVQCWRRSIGIDTVGLYIPGGSAPLFSTVLMLAVPATLAGCRKVVLCTPPDIEGRVHPAILYAAHLCGVHHIFKAGGVQAVAAMAYGTETVPKVHKIFGPGNQYVMAAKMLIAKSGCAIDMPAGPSELMVVADETSVPDFVAADLLSQAEHGPDSQVILVSCSVAVATDVERAVQEQLQRLPRKAVADEALHHSRFIVVPTMRDALDMANEYAPEHLILPVRDADHWAESVINAGSVFLGNYAGESIGDYASGTNHTLPTNGHAKAYSGVSLDSFVKKVTFQKLTAKGLQEIGEVVEAMAGAEKLAAHRNAVTVRLEAVGRRARL